MLICSEELYKESLSTVDLMGTRGATLETKGCILPIKGSAGRISEGGAVGRRKKGKALKKNKLYIWK